MKGREMEAESELDIETQWGRNLGVFEVLPWIQSWFVWNPELVILWECSFAEECKSRKIEMLKGYGRRM